MTELEIRRDVIQRFVGEGVTDLPAIEPMDLQESTSLYAGGEALGSIAQLIQGYSAACYESKHGREGIKKFSHQVKDSYRTVADHARLYGLVTNLTESARTSIFKAIRERRIYYTHLRYAMDQIENPEDQGFLLQVAAENGYGVEEFRNRLKDWKSAENEIERERALEVQQEVEEPEEPEVVEEEETEEAEVIEITLPNGEVVNLDRAIEAINEYADEQVEATVKEKEKGWHEEYLDLLARYDVEPNRTMKDLFDNLDEEKVSKLSQVLQSKINQRRDRAVNIVLDFSTLGSRIRDFRPEEFAQHAVGMEEEDIYFNHLTLLSEWLTETLQTWDSLRSGNLAEVSSLRRKGERS